MLTENEELIKEPNCVYLVTKQEIALELTKMYKCRGISHCIFSITTSLEKITTNPTL